MATRRARSGLARESISSPITRVLERDSFSETTKRDQGKIMRVHVVAEAEVVREAGAGKLAVFPAPVVVLAFLEPCRHACRVFAELILSRKYSDQRPRSLRLR